MELSDVLSSYVLIEDAAFTGEIGTSSQVKVRDQEDGFEEEFVIVGSQEADPATGKISDESPMGKALTGHKAGDEVTVHAPAGLIKYLILEVQ
jgi:transcription elongation factor GreA